MIDIFLQRDGSLKKYRYQRYFIWIDRKDEKYIKTLFAFSHKLWGVYQLWKRIQIFIYRNWDFCRIPKVYGNFIDSKIRSSEFTMEKKIPLYEEVFLPEWIIFESTFSKIVIMKHIKDKWFSKIFIFIGCCITRYKILWFFSGLFCCCILPTNVIKCLRSIETGHIGYKCIYINRMSDFME